MHHELYRQAVKAHAAQAAIQWGCGVGALSLTIGSIVLFRYLPIKPGAPIAAAGCVAAVGIVLIGESYRRDYETARDTEARMRQVLGYNSAAWLNLLTQPNKTALRQVEAVSTINQPLPLFDWHELADADNHPVLGIIAPMGGGKSRLIRYLAKSVLNTPTINVYDIYGRQSEWAGCTIIAEHAAMLEAMTGEIQAIAQDVADYRSGKQESQFEGTLNVMEEAADTLRSLRELGKEAKTITDLWVGKMTTVTRKIRRRLCIVSVKLSGADFGTGAESRDTATLIFPGIQGVALAMKDDRMLKLGARQNTELKQRLKDSLQGVQRPALVYYRGEWFPAALPELDGAGNLVGSALGRSSLPPTQPEPDVRESLNALYYSAEFAIEAELEKPSELYDTDGNLLRIPAAILAYAKQHPDGVTAKMCANGKWALRAVAADEIRRFFTLLAEARLGVVGEVDGELRFLTK
jgi:hypothetical protein